MVYQSMRQDETVNADKTEKNKKREREKWTWPEAWGPSGMERSERWGRVSKHAENQQPEENKASMRPRGQELGACPGGPSGQACRKLLTGRGLWRPGNDHFWEQLGGVETGWGTGLGKGSQKNGRREIVNSQLRQLSRNFTIIGRGRTVQWWEDERGSRKGFLCFQEMYSVGDGPL